MRSRGAALALVVPLCVVVVVVAYLAAALATGSSVPSVAGLLVAVVVGLFLPGVAVVRVLRREPVPLLDDCAWGGVAGVLVGLLGWALDRVLWWEPGPLVVGPAVVVGLLCVPALRRRMLRPPAAGGGDMWHPVVVAAAHVVAVGWMLSTALRGMPPHPGPQGFAYIPDMLFQLAMEGELSHALVPTYPMVAGTPLSYHWFVYAVEAHLSLAPGVDRVDLVLRLAPMMLVALLLVLAVSVARQLAERAVAGPLAAVLLAVVGNSVPTRWVVPNGISTRWNADGGSLAPISVYWQDSPPQTLGWVAGLACMALVVAVVRRSRADRVVPVSLLVPVFVLAAGAKSTQLPVVLGGAGLALLVALVTRRFGHALRALTVLVVGVGVFGAALATMYRAGSYGLMLLPGERLLATSSGLMVGATVRHFPGYAFGAVTAPAGVLVTTAVVYLAPLLPRLAGLVPLVARRAADPALWVPVGTLLAGTAGTFLTRHPTGSEVFFLVSAYPLAVVGSAAGLVVGLEGPMTRLRAATPALARALPVVGALGGLAVAATVAYSQPLDSPHAAWAAEWKATGRTPPVPLDLQEWAWLTPHVWLWSGAVGLTILLVVLTVLAGRRSAAVVRVVPAVLVAAVSVVLGTGVLGTWLHVHRGDGLSEREAALRASESQAAAGTGLVTPELLRAGRVVAAESPPDAVVATNRYCRRAPLTRAPCQGADFAVSATTRRRVDVSGWIYADRNLATTVRTGVANSSVPFWDPARLDAEQRVFTAPTAPALEELRRRWDVTWLVADRRSGPVDTDGLDQLATRRFTGSEILVWQLR